MNRRATRRLLLGHPREKLRASRRLEPDDRPVINLHMESVVVAGDPLGKWTWAGCHILWDELVDAVDPDNVKVEVWRTNYRRGNGRRRRIESRRRLQVLGFL